MGELSLLLFVALIRGRGGRRRLVLLMVPACQVVSMVPSAACMYGLPSLVKHRVRLVQECLVAAHGTSL